MGLVIQQSPREILQADGAREEAIGKGSEQLGPARASDRPRDGDGMKKFLKRLRRRRQLDRDLEDELRFHLEMRAEETGDASEARRRLGNVTLLKEACR